jgi:hypothetical protein
MVSSQEEKHYDEMVEEATVDIVRDDEKRSHDADQYMPDLLRSYTPSDLAAMEKALVRRIDLRSLPILIILFLLNILDRNAIANARLGGLEDDLGIADVQYQTAVMVLWGMESFPLMSIGALAGADEFGPHSWLHLHDGPLQYAAVQV